MLTKVGMKVKCIVENDDYLTHGKIYSAVVEIIKGVERIRIIDDCGNKCTLYDGEYEILNNG